jgi:hypothetical protein
VYKATTTTGRNTSTNNSTTADTPSSHQGRGAPATHSHLDENAEQLCGSGVVDAVDTAEGVSVADGVVDGTAGVAVLVVDAIGVVDSGAPGANRGSTAGHTSRRSGHVTVPVKPANVTV